MRWNIKSTQALTSNSKESFIDLLLSNRGISSKDKELFLNPPKIFSMLKDLPKDFRVNAKKAKELILQAISKNQPIVIHGDYDADGICATAILLTTIRNELGYKNCFAFIPNRFEHGYGLSIKSIDASHKNLKKEIGKFDKVLLITVDTGITSVEETLYAKKIGFDVIITDHHQKPETLPEYDCLVWCDEVVGSGVAWILSKVLGSKNPKDLALVALATVTDLQPLFRYNRSIVKEGLEILNTNPPTGIKILAQVAGKNSSEITTYDLGWVFGPRLNATGRIGSADDALLLLLENDETKALEHAKKLNQLNVDRQDKTMEMYDLATEISSKELPRVIISAHSDYHEGIIGLVAAKLVQKHYRPAMVLSINGELAKGSVRSVTGVDIIEFLRKMGDLFENVGGHPMAAGFTIKTTKIDELRKRTAKLAAEFILDIFLEPELTVDLKVSLSDVKPEFVKKINMLKPFGVGNPAPLFVAQGLGIVGFDKVGKDGSHLTLQLISEGKVYKAIYFGNGALAGELKLGNTIDIVFAPELNLFKGKEYLNIVIKDIQKADSRKL
ncbi:single-stranded-DNA-specific exonuclease RecJ [candidate division WWE3 bacterium]|nr:single-stranded-DNA-specific exonuclease RecJ [candidate division WWE3 bacterium]